MKLLVTGGTGYLGSHTCVLLLQAGYDVVIYDNLSNSSPDIQQHLQTITGRSVTLIEGDLRDAEHIRRTLHQHTCYAVLHFAGLKAVGESNQIPLTYYQNNVTGTLNLLEAMQSVGLHHLVFSSSATVYGEPQYLPLDEAHPLNPTNPYGRTKWMIEGILRDLCHSNSNWTVTILRYFNPVGAHESGLLNENPKGIPNNLMPYVAQVAKGERPFVNVWGNDYPTPDGTGVRDYIHVMDLAEGHLAALEKASPSTCAIYNLGTGRGYSVLDLIKAYEAATGQSIPYQIAPRRAGDIPECYANPTYAETTLQWRAKRDLNAMCESTAFLNPLLFK